jgi:hypothetical protein
MESIADIHFGIAACSPSAGRLPLLNCQDQQQCAQDDLDDPVTSDEGGILRRQHGEQHDRATMPASQPRRKPTLVTFALASNIKIAAMIGIGLIAIPTANGRSPR